MEKTTRRELLITLGAAAGGAILAGCHSGASGGGDAGGASCESVTTSIGSNHGHEVTVPAADVADGSMKTYTLVAASHTHEVTLSAADFDNLAAGQTVMVLSTTVLDHDHEITFHCA